MTADIWPCCININTTNGRPTGNNQSIKSETPALAKKTTETYIVAPQPEQDSLSSVVRGIDHTGAPVDTRVVTERPLTLYLNRQEIVTMMTIGDHPDLLAIGYLRNQNMLDDDDVVTGIDYDEEVDVVVVRTERDTDYEDKMRKKVRTSGCGATR